MRENLPTGSTTCRKVLRFGAKWSVPIFPILNPDDDVSIYFSAFIILKVRLKLKQIANGTSRCLSTRHENLWAEETIHLHTGLLATNKIRAFDCDNSNNFITFHSVTVHILLTRDNLKELHMRASTMNIVNVDGHWFCRSAVHLLDCSFISF